MSPRVLRHLWPAIAGALVSFTVRYAVGDLQIALIGLVVFALIYVVLVVLARAMRWPDAPMLNAVVATVSTTAAFLASHAQ